jgi:hypothetical protein
MGQHVTHAPKAMSLWTRAWIKLEDAGDAAHNVM